MLWLYTGGGAIEIELSKYLRDYSRTVAGKEQLIIAAVAKALEVIPRQLCDNAGFDSTNVLNRLREKHAKGVLVCYWCLQSIVSLLTGGGRPGIFHHVNYANVCVGRGWVEFVTKRMYFVNTFIVLNNEQYISALSCLRASDLH